VLMFGFHEKDKPLALVVTLLAAAPVAWAKEGSADRFPSDVASVWFDLLYDAVRSEGTPPPLASRIYGVTAVGLYESIVQGTEQNKSLVGLTTGPTAPERPALHRGTGSPS
jgi:hypothetical protein